jgi:hypothetical protein
MKKAYKFYWFNFDGKMQTIIFETEEIGFDWIKRYGVEYFDHKQTVAGIDEIWQGA